MIKKTNKIILYKQFNKYNLQILKILVHNGNLLKKIIKIIMNKLIIKSIKILLN